MNISGEEFMEDWESRFSRNPIQELRSTLATFRQAGVMRMRRVRRWRRWFVRGAIVGAAWSVLYAPQSGAEMRQALGRRIRPLAEIGASLLPGSGTSSARASTRQQQDE